MKAAPDPDLAYEVEAALAFFDEDAKAAIAALLFDIKELRRQLKQRPVALRCSCHPPAPLLACDAIDGYRTMRRDAVMALTF